MTDTLKILPVKKLKEESISKKTINKILPQPPFCWNLIASVKSGKTNFIINMIYNSNFYRDYFDEIYWFSPSIMNDKTAWAVRGDEDITIINDNLEEMDEVLKAIVEQQTEDNSSNVLLILDDCLNYLGKGYASLTSKFRHFNISIITSIQNLRKIPITSRYNATAWCIWKLHNTKEISKLDEEFGNFENFIKHYKEATKEKYSFLYIDVKDMTLRKNFGTILYTQ